MDDVLKFTWLSYDSIYYGYMYDDFHKRHNRRKVAAKLIEPSDLFLFIAGWTFVQLATGFLSKAGEDIYEAVKKQIKKKFPEQEVDEVDEKKLKAIVVYLVKADKKVLLDMPDIISKSTLKKAKTNGKRTKKKPTK